jgi:hypothetical protein
MKRWFSFLLAMLPFAAVTTSCDDDGESDLPDVDVTATISGGTFYEGEIYIVQGQALTIESMTLDNYTKQDGAIGSVTYYWDHYLFSTQMVQPFTFTIQTSEQTVGKHLLQAQMPIYVAGYSVCWGFIQYYVNIVATADDMPEGAYIAGNQITMVDCAIQRNATIN